MIRLCLVWIGTTAVLLYGPLSYQRRFSLGLYIPLVVLAINGLENLLRSPQAGRTAFIGLLVLCLPSNLLIVGAGLSGLARQDPAITYLEGELETYHWLETHAPPGSLVLSAMAVGNRLPAYADVRVVYGHPFETPRASCQEIVVEELYQWQGDPLGAIARLQDLGVAYVIFSPWEEAIGAPAWLSRIPQVYSNAEFQVRQVPAR
jgi:hypothetical protein